MRAIDLTGRVFGRLTVKYPVPGTETDDGIRRWHCVCSCDKHTEVDVTTHNLRSGLTRSCGCIRYENAAKAVRKDLTNQRFGKLVALYPTDKRYFSNVIWHCKCDCKRETDVSSNQLLMGNTKSCGNCGYQKQRVSEALTKYTDLQRKVRDVFKGMLNRCYNPKTNNYKNYGARGIRVCDEWRNDPMKFINWAIDHGWKPGMDVDRYPDQDGNYSPDNCRLTYREENNNNKRTNVRITVLGIEDTCARWDRYFGFPASTMSHYVQRHGKDAADEYIKRRLARRERMEQNDPI